MEKSFCLTSIKDSAICDCHNSECNLSLNMLSPFHIYIILVLKINVSSFCMASPFPSFTRNATKISEDVYGKVLDIKLMKCNDNLNHSAENNFHDPDNLW